MKLLPKLKSDASTDFDQTGAFKITTSTTGGILENLAQFIEINQTAVLAPSSTPVVFERPLQTRSMLSDKTLWPSVSLGFEQDWRALVTLMALSEMNGYKIKLMKKELSAEKIGEENTETEFVKVCSVVLPSINAGDNPFNKSNWDTVYTIVYNYNVNGANDDDIVLGALSPYTIVWCSKDFRKIVTENDKLKDKFNFIDYDDSNYKEKDDKAEEKVEEKLDKLLKEQFAHFSKRERRSIYEWLNRVLPFCGNVGASYKLIYDFRKSLCDRFSELRELEENGIKLYFPETFFAENAFIEKEEIEKSGFKELNFSVKKVPLQREWEALFTAFALKDLKNLNLKASNDEKKICVVWGNGEAKTIAKAVPHVLIEPDESGISQIIGDIGLISDGEVYIYDKLSEFEKQCIAVWLESFMKDERVKASKQLFKYASDFRKKLPSDAKLTCEYFVSNFLDRRTEELSVIDFCVNGYISVILNGGEYKDDKAFEAVSSQWLDTLKVIAFSCVRDIEITASASGEVYNNYDPESSLFSGKEGYKQLEFSYGGKVFAVTSRACLIAVTNYKVIEKLASNLVLRDCEKLLFVLWLEELKTRVEGSGYIGKGAKELAALDKILTSEAKKLKQEIYAPASEHRYDGDAETAKKYFKFTIPKKHKGTVSTAVVFYAEIEDMLFNDYLICSGSQEPFECDIVNKATEENANAASVYAIYKRLENGGEGVMKQNSYVHGTVLLPFKDEACEAMYSSFYSCENKNVSDISAYGLDYVKVYLGEANGYDVHVKHSAASLEFTKHYNAEKTVEYKNKNEFPDISIWPDVEIEGWNSYVMSAYVRENQEGSVSLPYFIPFEQNHSGVKRRHISNLYDYKTKEAITFDFDSYYITKYPRMLKMSYKGKSGWFFVRSRDMVEPDAPSYIAASPQNSNVFIGIDFGTTNSTAYISDSSYNQVEAFDYSRTVSNNVTNRLVGGKYEINSVISPRPIYNKDESSKIFSVSTAFFKYGDLDAEMPLYDSTFMRVAGNEVASEKSIFEHKNFAHDLKWTARGESESSRGFLLQLVLSVCIYAKKVLKQGVSSIELRVSYPSSMPTATRKRLMDEWNKINGSISDLTGLDVSTTPKFLTESFCAGVAASTGDGIYGANDTAGDSRFICADIGGGSVDMAFFTKGIEKMSASASASFAGRMILSGGGNEPAVRDETELLKELVEDLKKKWDGIDETVRDEWNATNIKLHASKAVVAKIQKRLSSGSKKVDFEFLCDVTISNIYDVFCDLSKLNCYTKESFPMFLERCAGKMKAKERDRPIGRLYLSRIKVGIAAFAYFMGVALEETVKRSGGKPTTGVDVYFSGNGSKILEWIVYNNDKINTFADNNSELIVAEYIKAGIGGGAKTVRVHRSLKPKTETAFALTCRQATEEINNKGGNGHISADETDSFAPINADGLFYETESLIEFKEILKERMTKNKSAFPVFDENTIKEILELGNKKEIAEAVAQKINPDFEKDKVITIIGGFLKALKRISPEDSKMVLQNISHDIKEDNPVTEKDNPYLYRMINNEYETITRWGARATTGKSPMPVHDFTPYALLEFVMLILNGSFKGRVNNI